MTPTNRGLHSHSSQEELGEVSELYLPNIDIHDKGDVARWARSVCQGGSLHELASLLRVAPTLDDVIKGLTESLPDSTQAMAADICRSELGKEPK